MKDQKYYLSLIEKILIKCQNILKDTKPKKIRYYQQFYQDVKSMTLIKYQI